MPWMQKINHFAGMLELCRKKTLARNISAMAAQFPGHFEFCPKTYVLPEDLPSLWKDFKSPKKGKTKTLILKPDSGSQVPSFTNHLHDQIHCTIFPLHCPCIALSGILQRSLQFHCNPTRNSQLFIKHQYSVCRENAPLQL